MHLGGRTATGSRSSVMCLSLGHKLHNFPELESFREMEPRIENLRFGNTLPLPGVERATGTTC